MAQVRTNALALAFILGALSTPVLAQSSDEAADADRVRYTLGLKLWYNNWETWPSERSDTKLAWIPALGVSYGNYFGSFSYFNKTRYNFPVTIGNADRREMDLSVGYWVLQGEGGRLGLSAGYKDVRQKFAGFDETITAPFVGFTGASHVSGPWSLYMSGAYGRATETGPGFKARGYYMSGEAGLAYSLGRGTVLTAGYKIQVIDVGGGDCDASIGVGTGAARCRDTTDGFIVGISHTF
jgi:hypothetical protein